MSPRVRRSQAWLKWPDPRSSSPHILSRILLSSSWSLRCCYDTSDFRVWPAPHHRACREQDLAWQMAVPGAGQSTTLSHYSHVQLFATPWTIASQAPLSMELSWQEYWSGLPFPSPGDLSDPGIEATSLISPALAGWFFTTSATWEARQSTRDAQNTE